MRGIFFAIAAFGFSMVAVAQSEDRTTGSAARDALRQRIEAAQRELTATGASSCSGSNCHSGGTPRPGEVFLATEWDLWWDRGQGSHFRAFKTLSSDRSERMAKILYGADAVAREAAQCRACHALDAPKERQGGRFDIEDGVTCEACHGRSEKWLGPHQNADQWRRKMTAQQREAAGFLDLRDVVRRAEKCLECHAGTEEKRASHALMAAGHPTITLDLATDLFSVPLHWKDRQSYLSESEGSWYHARVWAVGQAVALRESVRRLAVWAASDDPPDLTLFECYACHHDLDESKNWRQRRGFEKTPGDPVWESSAALLSRPLMDMFLPDAQAAFVERLAVLRKSVSIHGADRSAVRQAAEELTAIADQLVAKVAACQFDFERTMRLARAVVDRSEEILAGGYRAAERAFRALDALYRLAVADSAHKPGNHDAIMKTLAEFEGALYSTEGKEGSAKKEPAPQRYDPFLVREILKKLAVQIG